jgi:hypothetical protein
MADKLKLYNDVKRKRELVESMQKILELQLSAAEVLDGKAWELLKVSSATFGLGAVLEITLTEGKLGAAFWVVLSIVLVCYIVQSILVILVVRPRKWGLVPGVPPGTELLFETLLPRYMIEYDTERGQYVP